MDADKSLAEAEVPSAYPMVQPMKAALYFDSAEGFGEWRILMSTKAEKSLREARRHDANVFKIIIKKIKELSNGHFSDDNQKRLTGPSTEIPVFEAKMTRDTRLVVCIPVCAPYMTLSEIRRSTKWIVSPIMTTKLVFYFAF
jgi:hypothetical protein